MHLGCHGFLNEIDSMKSTTWLAICVMSGHLQLCGTIEVEKVEM